MKKRKIFSAVMSAVLMMPLVCACSDRTAPPSVPERSAPADASDQSQPSAWESESVFTCGGVKYDVAGVNVVPEGNGVYYFDGSFGTAAPASDGEFIDYAVVMNTLAAVYENEPAIIPEEGFVARFVGVKPEKECALGETARYSVTTETYLPERFVRFGNTVIEVGYRNVVRIDEDTGFLFDGGWYNSTTRSNIYGTEIAVDAEGTVVEVNRSGSADSGDTFIPEGGFVLAVGQGSTSETRLASVAVGDKAEYVERDRIYTVKRFIANDKDPSGARPDNQIVYYSGAANARTPAGSGTDVIIGADGVVTDVIENAEDGSVIPAGGCAVCATGKYSSALRRSVEPGDVFSLTAIRNLCFIRNPETRLSALRRRLDTVHGDYLVACAELDPIDYSSADSAYTAAKALLASPGTGETLAESIKKATKLLSECETALIPCAFVGDRAAWVTVGERDHNGTPYLHYCDQASVDRTVDYAASLNINTLIIDNLASGYTVYPSAVPGLVRTDLAGDFDVIAAFERSCTERGIRLIVMVCALMSVPDNAVFPEDHYINLYSDKVLKTQKGRTSDGYGAVALDPSRPEVRALINDTVRELAVNYPGIYGVQIDYIRYPLPVYYQKENYEDFGYDSPASDSFRTRFGVDPKTLSIDDPLWDEWCEARCEAVTSLAGEIAGTLRSVRSDINVSFTCFADANDRAKYVFQQPELWASLGYADAVYPMIYGDSTPYQRKYAEQISGAAEHADVLLGVGAYVRATHRSMAEQLYMPFKMGYSGSSVFTLRYISVCGYNDLFYKAFRYPSAPSHSEGYLSSAVEFAALRAEWLGYLYPTDEALAEYRLRVTNYLQPDVHAAADFAVSALDGLDFTDKTLAETLRREAELLEKLA